jgi:hypothetical protein
MYRIMVVGETRDVASYSYVRIGGPMDQNIVLEAGRNRVIISESSDFLVI